MGKRTQRPKVTAQGFKAEAEQRAELARIHGRNVAAEPPPRAPRMRWIVPRAYGRPIAHAHLEGAARTMCLGVPAGGGVYPPAEDVPRCEECVVAVKRREEHERASTLPAPAAVEESGPELEELEEPERNEPEASEELEERHEHADE